MRFNIDVGRDGRVCDFVRWKATAVGLIETRTK